MNKYRAMNTWDVQDRPRERMIEQGRRALSEAELLAILVGSGSQNESALELCRKIWNKVDQDMNLLAKMDIHDLCEFKGMGQAKAVRIIAALELGRRRKEQKIKQRPLLDSSLKVFEYLKHVYMDLLHEESWVLFLDAGSRLIKKELIGKGGATFTPMDVKVVLWHALDCRASSIIITHNHPSGALKASRADIYLTDKLIAATEVFDICVQDHLIFGGQGYLSFRDEGLID
ncbi:MAG TPA: DNA repair protein RadC [Sphingobacteriaceae bacterium]|nr:DNA repair protein RadC [Sphingobacteriaceae bacterium]